MGLPASLLFKKITSSKRLLERFTKILEDFFENYSDEKEASSEKTNYRDFVPEEYLNIFDLIYKEYKTDKTKALTLFISVVYKIREKIFYDIKLEKYREPIVINNSSYVHLVK